MLNPRDRWQYAIPRDRYFDSIEEALETTKPLLRGWGIDYEELYPALVPNPAARDIRYLFEEFEGPESNAFDSEIDAMLPRYGRAIDAVLPLFDRESSHSVRVGRLSGDEHDDILLEAVGRERVFTHRTHAFERGMHRSIVFVSNIRESEIADFHRALPAHASYFGLVDLTLPSDLRRLAALSLDNFCLKHNEHIIVCGLDLSTADSREPALAPFTNYGYKVHAADSHCFHALLAYKVEGIVAENWPFDDDGYLITSALEAVGAAPKYWWNFRLDIDGAQLAYPNRMPSAKLEKTHGGTINRKNLVVSTETKMVHDYVYNITPVYDEGGVTCRFDVALEFKRADRPGHRVIATLRYRPDKDVFRVINVT